MSRYYSSYGHMPNTCSIKFLPKAYIGNGIRMTADKSTVEFDNKPMKGMVIENYNKQGFRISHPSMPKSFWVDFDQLPLTRLTIHNGVIEDEITFVENIVNHRMQLIRTLDTEYVDLIYKEKALEQKKDQIIPISQAIPGEIYIGAQCEEGNEMIFLGSFFIKPVHRDYNYNHFSRGWGRNEREERYFFHKSTPQRAFFAIPSNELAKAEERQIESAYYGEDGDGYDRKMDWQERERLSKIIREEKDQMLKRSTARRYKIVSYATTSKRIKDVILTNKENRDFSDIELNREIINYNSNYTTNPKNTYPKPNVDIKITNHWWDDTFFAVSKTREGAEKDAREIAQVHHNIKIQNCYYEERHNR